MSAPHDFFTAIVHSDRTAAVAIARRALAESGNAMDVYSELLQQSLYEVGRRWQAGELTVAEEHAATATVQFVLSALYLELPRTAETRGAAVVAGIAGEMHQVGAHMVADALEADGWRVHFLGAGVPVTALVDAIGREGASLVGLSVTMPGNLPVLVDTIGAVRRRFGGSVRVLVGGQGWRGIDVRRFGADASAVDVVDARDVARELASP